MLDSEFWGQGYATEAAQTIKDWAINELKTDHLISLIQIGNTRSERIAEKLDGHITMVMPFKGKEVQMYSYAL